jgi:uncharacterized protein with ParB-like and HNH nuclease domain
MDISLDLKRGKDTRLFLIKNQDKDNDYLLLKDFDSGLNSPILYLELINGKFTINQSKSNMDLITDMDLDAKLDALALRVTEAVQNGEDINDIVVGDEKPYDPSKIRCESRNFSLKQVYDMIESESHDIDLHPDFQRNVVWDNLRKSRLIESIILGVPLPMFYFAEDENGQLSIIDGLQRLNAIYEFMSGKFSLVGLEYLDNCKTKFEGLEVKYKRRINMTQISCIVILPESPAEVKYNIFRRINTGGRPLNSQELRNCMSGQNLRATLKEMVDSKEFVQATSGSVKDIRMDAQELALRFIYFRDLLLSKGIESYNGSIDSELDNLTDSLKRKNLDTFKIYVSSFKKSMKLAFHLFGDHAFRRIFLDKSNQTIKRSIINKALFSSISVLLSFYTDADVKKILQKPNGFLILPFGQAMSDDTDYKRYLSYGTNGKQNIVYSFRKAQQLLENNLGVKLQIVSPLLLAELELLNSELGKI